MNQVQVSKVLTSLQILKTVHARLFNVLLWISAFVFATGGVYFNGRLKLNFIHDFWVTISVVYILGRVFLKNKMRDLHFGQSFFALFDWITLYPIQRPQFKNTSTYFLLGLLLYCMILFFFLPILNYWSFGNFVFDLGVIENSIYNGALSGRFDTYFLENGNGGPVQYLPNNRLNLGLIFFAGIYKFWPKTEFILFLQSLALASAVIPLYKLADLILPRSVPRWFALLYYFFWDPIHRMNIWDLHETPFVLVFSLWGFYYLEKRSYLKALVFFVFMAIWREDAWLTAGFAALYFGFISQRWRLALPLMILSLSILPLHVAFFNVVNSLGQRYPYLGNGFKSAIHTLIQDPLIFIKVALKPMNREFFGRLFLNSGGGIFLLSGLALLPLIPNLLEVGLADHDGMLSWLNHYVGSFGGPLFFATLKGWAYIDRRLNWGVRADESLRFLMGISLALSFSQLAFSEPGALKIGLSRYRDTRCLETILAKVPPDVPVAAVDPLAARLAKRKIAVSPYSQSLRHEALWLVTDKLDDLQTVGRPNELKTRPWTLVYQSCGWFVAKRPAR